MKHKIKIPTRVISFGEKMAQKRLVRLQALADKRMQRTARRQAKEALQSVEDNL